MVTSSKSPPEEEPATPAAVTLALGPEELLADRAVARLVAHVRAADPGADVRDLAAGELESGMLTQLTNPSLFGERTVLVVRAAHDLSKDVAGEVVAYLADPADHVALVLTHSGVAKNKGLVDTARRLGARVVNCPKVVRPSERVAFVREELGRAGRTATEPAARALLDAVGTDLREVASACAQLADDTDGLIDEQLVARYYRGRAEVTSFQIADAAVEGRLADAVQQLRWLLSVGGSPLGVTAAMALGLRALVRVAGAGRVSRPADLARDLKMPPWKVDRARQQLRGWTPAGMTEAVRAVAAADEEVKTGAADKSYAVERAVAAVVAARSRR